MDRELDQQIARLLGWTWNERSAWSPSGSMWARVKVDGQGPDDPWAWLPHYSTSIEAAWDALEHFREAGWLVVVKAMPEGGAFLAGDDWTRDPKVRERYVCEIARLPYANDYEAHPQGRRVFWAGGKTPAEAICRAAVRVVVAEKV